MKWEKIGRIFEINSNQEWMHSHAALPTIEKLVDDIFRVYFSPRDIHNRSHVAYFDININNPFNILNISCNPVLRPGEIGLFDDAGVLPNSIIIHEDKKIMYYTGWHLGVTIPFQTYCGIAVWNNKTQKFQRNGRVPIMDRTEDDPLSIGVCDVKLDGTKFKMWYESREKYNQDRDIFVIKYAESDDGIRWERKNVVCIAPMCSNESMMARPSVIIENGIYNMWYSYKINNKYKIGYAESNDGLEWSRMDEDVGITTSTHGWDSEEIEYPCVFDHNGDRYMLYNGNNYGKTGIGLAKLKYR